MKELFTIMLVALFVMTLLALAHGDWKNAGIAGVGLVLIAAVLLVWECAEHIIRRVRGEGR